jgi:hypothetical protein
VLHHPEARHRRQRATQTAERLTVLHEQRIEEVAAGPVAERLEDELVGPVGGALVDDR